MTTIPHDRLEHILRRTGRLVLWTELLRVTAAALGGGALALLAAVFLDVVFSLPAWALIVVDCGAVVLVLVAGFRVARVARSNAHDPRRAARLIEDRLGLRDSRIINAVEFLLGRHNRTASGELIARSVEAAEECAGAIDPSGVVRTDRLKRSLGFALVMLAVLGAANLAFGPAFGAAFARYLHPTAENAPFTLVSFEVSIEPQKVHFGRPAAIWARLSGAGAPDQANVVFLNAPRQSLPMLRQPDGRFVLRIDKAAADRDFYVDTPAGRSGVYHLTVLPVPEVLQLTARYTFPAYTGWPSAAQAVESGGIKALERTTVTLTIKSNLPLKSALLVLAPSQPQAASCLDPATQPAAAACPVPATQVGQACPVEDLCPPSRPPVPGQSVVTLVPDAQDPASATGSFLLNSSGRFRLTIVGDDGLASNQPVEGVYTSVPDAPPTIEMLDPGEEVVAPAGEKVPVRVSARDDVAVRRIVLHRGVNGWMPSDVELPLESSGPTFAQARYVFDLPAIGARAGDVISYYASAHDNCPDREQFSDTPVYVIRVISQEDYVAYLRTKVRMDKVMEEMEEFRQATDDLDARRDEILKDYQKLQDKILSQGGAANQGDRRRLDEIAAKQAEYEKRAIALADRMRKRAAQQPELYDFEKAYADILNHLADAAADRAIGSRALRENLPAVAPPGVPPFVEAALAHFQAEQGRDQPPDQDLKETHRDLDRLRRADEMVAQTERIMAVSRLQRELADRMGQFRNKERLSPTEQIRAKRMADEQAQLEKDLQDALAQMKRLSEENAEALPTMSASVARIAASAEDLKILRDQQDAQRLAEGGSGRYAAAAAESAASKLESLIHECGGSEGMMNCDDLDKALKLTRVKMGQSLQQLAQGRGIPGSGGPGSDGYYGSRSAVRVMGLRGSGDSPEARTGRGYESRSPTTSRGSRDSSAEKLDPQAAASRGQGGAAVGAAQGVPARYRPLVEAYFRRLADESK